jgi:hypothetical protein
MCVRLSKKIKQRHRGDAHERRVQAQFAAALLGAVFFLAAIVGDVGKREWI